MKENEKIFFRLCLNAFVFKKQSDYYKFCVRDLINIIQSLINYKQCWYYLDKWSNRGFYDYGVTMDLGWFEPDKFTGEYKDIYDDIMK